MSIQNLEDEKTIREAELKETEKKLAEAKKAEAIENWKKLRASCRDTKDKLRELEREFHRAETKVSKAEHDIDVAEASLFVQQKTAPRPDDFPSDEEVKEQQKREADMVVALEPLREKRRDLTATREQLRHQVLALNADFQRMVYAERNARMLAEGKPLGEWS